MLTYIFKNTLLQKRIENLTLWHIMLLALAVRLIAAFFSVGYAMHDDHFNVIEIAQSWADGGNIGAWLPTGTPAVMPDISHSLFYTGIHYLLFTICKVIGLQDPQLKMLLVRVLHAFYSLLTVYYGYKITEKIADKEAAKWAALLLALLWFMPNLAVRNLVEIVCIPPLLAGTYYVLKNPNYNWKNYFLSGFIIAFAFSFRYQTALIIAAVGLVFLIQKEWRGFVIYSLGVLLNIFIFQCIADILLWGYPLAEFLGYIQYNILHKADFITGYWFNYSLLISGLVLPPFSVLLWFGYFKNMRAHLLLFLPSFIFLVFHSSFENKQERFILPFIPYLIILGFAGWQNAATQIAFSTKWIRITKYTILIILALNMLLLIPVSVASTKTSKVNAMYYLYTQKDVQAYLVEMSHKDGWEFFPQFYLGKWCPEYFVIKGWSAENVKTSLTPQNTQPNYVVFLSDENINQRVEIFKKSFPHIQLLTTIHPSMVDVIFHKLNPINKSEPCFVYRINK